MGWNTRHDVSEGTFGGKERSSTRLSAKTTAEREGLIVARRGFKKSRRDFPGYPC